MKILHILSTSKWTGPSQFVLDINEYFLENGINSIIALRTKPGGNLIEFIKEKKLNFYDKLYLYKKFNPFYFFHDLIVLKDFLKNFNPDIVHVHFSLEHILAVILKKNFKLIRSVYNTKSAKKRFLSSHLFKKADFIHTVCSEYSELLLKFNNVDSKKIKIINGWVNENTFSPSGEKDFFKFNDKIKIGMVARFQKRRAHSTLVKAFSQLDLSNKILVLTGKGEYMENIKKLVKELNIVDQVIFTGYIKDKLPVLLRSLDIFVLLEEGTDGSCRALLEAMAVGLPVIGVNKGGMKEAIIDGKNGFLISSKNSVNELKEKLKILCENRELREEFGKNSRKIVLEKFSKRKNLEKFLNFYRMVKND